MRRPCLVCGAPTSESYCPKHSTRAGSSASWRRLRAEVLRRDGYACTRCGATEQLVVHHVNPRAEGGPDAVWNLETVCRPDHEAEHGAIGW